MNLDTDTLEKQWAEKQRLGQDKSYFNRPGSVAPSVTTRNNGENEDAQRKVQEIKELLLRFKFPHSIREGSPDYHLFQRLLALNDQLQTPKNICLQCWSFANLTQTMDHINLLKHTIIYQDKFSDIDRFL